MPIGKNALKRVSNNGYSGVNTSAPDMENSVITETVQTEEKTDTKKVTKTEKKAETKTEVKTAQRAAAKTETVAKTTKKANKSAEKKADTVTHPDGFVKVALGMDMPAYLL